MAVRVPVDIEVDGDAISDHIDADARRARAAASSSGNRSGSSWAAGFNRSARSNLDFGTLLPEFRFRVGPLQALLAAVAPLAPAFGLAAGAIVPATAALASFGLAAGTVAVGMQGLGDAFAAQGKVFEEIRSEGQASAESLKELDVALKRLHPSARAFVKEAVALAPAWSAVRRQVQGRLFEGTAESLRALGTSILPVLSANLQGVAADLNATARGWVASITSAEGVEKTSTILSGMRAVLKDLVPAVGNLAAGLLTLFGASLGPASSLSDTLLDLSVRFRNWSNDVASNGSFAAFLQGAMSAFGTILDVVVDLGAGLGTLFKAATGDSLGFLGIIADIAEAFRGFASGAPESLQRVLGVLLLLIPASTLLTSVLGPIVGLLGGISLPVLGVVAAVAALGAAFLLLGGNVKPLGDALKTTAGVIATSFKDVLPTIQEVGGQIIDAFVPAVQSIVDTVAKDLLPAINGLIPILASFGAVMLRVLGPTVVNTIKSLGLVFSGLIKIVAGAINIVVGLLTGDWTLAWNGVKSIVIGALSVVGGILRNFFGGTLLTVVRSGLTLVLGLFRAIWNGVRAVVAGAIAGIIGVVRGGVLGIVRVIGSTLGLAIGIVGRVLGTVRSVFSSVLNSLRGIASKAFGAVRSIVASVLGSIRGAVAGGVNAVRSVIASGFGALSGIVSGAFGRVRNAVRSGVNNVVSLVRGLPGRAAGALGGLGSLLYGKGQQLIGGFIDGIKSMASKVASTAKSVLGGISKFVPGSPVKEGPLKVFNDGYTGKKLIEMFGDGIKMGKNELLRSTGSTVGGIVPITSGSGAVAAQRQSAAPSSVTTDASVQINQNYYGPTTSGGRLRELDWTMRYATKARGTTTEGLAIA